MPENKVEARERTAFVNEVKNNRMTPESGSEIRGQSPPNPVLQESVTWSRPKSRNEK